MPCRAPLDRLHLRYSSLLLRLDLLCPPASCLATPKPSYTRRRSFSPNQPTDLLGPPNPRWLAPVLLVSLCRKFPLPNVTATALQSKSRLQPYLFSISLQTPLACWWTLNTCRDVHRWAFCDSGHFLLPASCRPRHSPPCRPDTPEERAISLTTAPSLLRHSSRPWSDYRIDYPHRLVLHCDTNTLARNTYITTLRNHFCSTRFAPHI